MENFKRRLLKFSTEVLNLSQSAFEDSCGLPHGTISSIKVKGPSVQVLMKISSAYPDLDLNWLIMGRGEMFSRDNAPAPATKSTLTNDIHHNGTVNINYSALKEVIMEAIKESRQ